MRFIPEIPAFSYGVLIRGREGEKVTESVIFRQQNNYRNQHLSAIDQISNKFFQVSRRNTVQQVVFQAY